MSPVVPHFEFSHNRQQHTATGLENPVSQLPAGRLEPHECSAAIGWILLPPGQAVRFKPVDDAHAAGVRDAHGLGQHIYRSTISPLPKRHQGGRDAAGRSCRLLRCFSHAVAES